jgi:S1-C subfamily serine protease
MPTAVMREAATGQPVAGIGFALPANHVLEVAGQIVAAGGPLPRPSLGAEHAEVTAEVARKARLRDGVEGVLVTAVASGGPAAEAGIRPGDVITTVDGEAVDEERPLLNVLRDKEPGQTVTVVLDRNGSIIETQVRLGQRS